MIRKPFVQTIVAAIYLAIGVHAFHANLQGFGVKNLVPNKVQTPRPMASQGAFKSRTVLSSRSALDMFGGHRLKLCSATNLQRHKQSKSSALFSSSSATSGENGVENRKKSLIARLRWLLFFPVVRRHKENVGRMCCLVVSHLSVLFLHRDSWS